VGREANQSAISDRLATTQFLARDVTQSAVMSREVVRLSVRL